jgi:hypothetical protein
MSLGKGGNTQEAEMKGKFSRWIMCGLAVTLALGSAGFAYAEPGGPPRQARRGALIQGEVTAIAGDALTVETERRGEITVQTDADTKFRAKDNADFSLADIQVGDTIAARGRFIDDTTLQARLVALVPPELADHVRGEVAAIDGDTLTVEDKDGNEVGVVTSADTRFHLRGKPDASIDDIEPGMRLAAAGQFDADGNLAALQVLAGEPRERRLLKGGPIVAGKVSEVNDGEFVLLYPDDSTLTVTTGASTIVITRGENGPTLGSLEDIEQDARIVVLGVPSEDGSRIDARVILLENQATPIQP